jgi:hypothetical protein
MATTLHPYFNKGAKEIFGPEKEELLGGWKKLHIEELCNLYSSANFPGLLYNKDEMNRVCSMHGEMTSACNILARKPQGRLKCRWKY